MNEVELTPLEVEILRVARIACNTGDHDPWDDLGDDVDAKFDDDRFDASAYRLEWLGLLDVGWFITASGEAMLARLGVTW